MGTSFTYGRREEKPWEPSAGRGQDVVAEAAGSAALSLSRCSRPLSWHSSRNPTSSHIFLRPCFPLAPAVHDTGRCRPLGWGLPPLEPPQLATKSPGHRKPSGITPHLPSRVADWRPVGALILDFRAPDLGEIDFCSLSHRTGGSAGQPERTIQLSPRRRRSSNRTGQEQPGVSWPTWPPSRRCSLHCVRRLGGEERRALVQEPQGLHSNLASITC